MTEQRKTIFIHIGSPKTGTTALQTAFKACDHLLLENGILYPNAMFFGGHHDIARNLKNMDNDQIVTQFFKDIQSANQKNSFNNVVVSSETFFSFALAEEEINPELLSGKITTNIRRLRLAIPEEFQVKIVAYIRRQDLALEAKYNQRVKYNINYTQPFPEFYKKIMGRYTLNYDFLLGQWAQEFGFDNIIVRPYEKTQLPEGTVIDFLKNILQITDENLIKQISQSSEMDNPRLNRDLLEYKRILNQVYKKDLLLRNELYIDFLQVNDQMESNEKYSNLLSMEERKAILSHYADSNSKVAQIYLGRADGVLFMDPLPEDGESYPGLSVEKAIEIGWRLNRLQTVRIENQIEELHRFKSIFDNFPGMGKLKTLLLKINNIKYRAIIKRIEKSGLFDSAYYVNTYPLVLDTGMDPLQHYLNFGWKEGFNPSRHFNTIEYLALHPKANENGVNPLIHFLFSKK